MRIKPSISIIVAVYNIEKYIKACLESISHQHFRDFEVIVVDDGSTDRSGEICDDYARLDNRFRIIHQMNKGLSQARNVGIEAALGRYIAFVDGDDRIHPQLYEFLYTAAQRSCADITMADYVMTADLKYEEPVYSKEFKQDLYTTDAALRQLAACTMDARFHVVWNKLYSRDLIGEHRFRDLASEDSDFNMGLYLQIDKIAHVPLSLVYYTQRNDSLSNDKDNLFLIKVLVSYFESYKTYLQKGFPAYEELFLWRSYKRFIKRRHVFRGTPYEQLATDTFDRLKNDYWSDFKRCVSWPKRVVWVMMWNQPWLYLFLMKAKALQYRLLH